MIHNMGKGMQGRVGNDDDDDEDDDDDYDDDDDGGDDDDDDQNDDNDYDDDDDDDDQNDDDNCDDKYMTYICLFIKRQKSVFHVSPNYKLWYSLCAMHAISELC